MKIKNVKEYTLHICKAWNSRKGLYKYDKISPKVAYTYNKNYNKHRIVAKNSHDFFLPNLNSFIVFVFVFVNSFPPYTITDTYST